MIKENNLYSVIYHDIQDALQELLQITKPEHLVAIGLGMVEDLCGFFYVGCTQEQLRNVDDIHKAWWISEWHYSSTANNHVHDVITALYHDLGENCTDQQYVALREIYQNTIIQVLQDLRAEGKLINSNGEEVIVIIQYADASDEAFEELSFPLINAEFLVPLFKNRFKTHNGDNLYDYLLAK